MKKSRLLGAVRACVTENNLFLESQKKIPLRKYLTSYVIGLLILTGLGQANAAPIRVAQILTSGNDAAAQIFSSGDLAGTLTQLSPGTFNTLTINAMVAIYDVIIIGCCDSTIINADFSTRLLPYLNQGGGVIFENASNIISLSPAITATPGASGGTGIFVSASVPGLTEGILSSFVNSHIIISSYDPLFSEFLLQDTGAAGLYGEFSNGGRMVITGPDNFFHGLREGTGAALNQYNLALNELRYVTSGSVVPIPAAVWLFGSGVLGLVGMARRK